MDNPTRRRVLAAGLAGTALGLIGGRGASAAAAARPAAPAAGAPPAHPTDADLELLTFAQSAELTAQDLYTASLDAGVEDQTIGVLRDNHQAYAQVLAGLLGTRATDRADEQLFAELEPSFAVGDVAAVATAGYDLESALVATHTELLRALEGTDGAELLASILIVEARSCTVLADLAGNGDDLDLLFVNEADPVDATPQAGG